MPDWSVNLINVENSFQAHTYGSKESGTDEFDPFWILVTAAEGGQIDVPGRTLAETDSQRSQYNATPSKNICSIDNEV
jgi:hypothetical protein